MQREGICVKIIERRCDHLANENREYKDSVFTDLFYRDRDAKKNLLSLHNALFDEHLANAEQIELMRLEKTLFRAG